jgi:hypothetical protein
VELYLIGTLLLCECFIGTNWRTYFIAYNRSWRRRKYDLHVEFSESERRDLLKPAWNMKRKGRWRRLQQENGTVQEAASQHEQRAKERGNGADFSRKGRLWKGRCRRRITYGRTETVAPFTGIKWVVAGETDWRRVQYRTQVSVWRPGASTIFQNNLFKWGRSGCSYTSSVSLFLLIKF